MMKWQRGKFERWRETDFRPDSGFNESAQLVSLPLSGRLGGGRVHPGNLLWIDTKHARFSMLFNYFAKMMRSIEIVAVTDNMAAIRVKN